MKENNLGHFKIGDRVEIVGEIANQFLSKVGIITAAGEVFLGSKFTVRLADGTEFDFRDAAPFEGLEGEPRVKIDPRAIRAAYLESLNAHLEKVERIARGFGFEYVRMGTHDWLGPPLAAFLARRNAVIKRSKYG